MILPEIDRALTRSGRARERAGKRHKTAIENLPESRSGHSSESTKIPPSATTFSASDSTPEISSRPSSGRGKIAPAATLSSHRNSPKKSSPETSSEREKISTSPPLSFQKNSIPETAPFPMEICSSRKPETDVDKEMEPTPHTQKSGADEELKSAENLSLVQASSSGVFPLHPTLTRRERHRLANAEKRAGKLRVKPLGKA